MPMSFDRSICRDIHETISREWLITNGVGGYAAGTIAGAMTRVQHGLLVTHVGGENTPRLLSGKIDEEILFDQRTYYLGTNEYPDGTLNPAGFVHLESFRLEEGFPIFTYHLGGIDGIVLEKRIWMPHGFNTTYIQYRMLRTSLQEEHASRNLNPTRRYDHSYAYADAAQRVLTLKLLPFTAYRPYNKTQHGNLDWQFQVETQHIDYDPSQKENDQSIAGCSIRAWDGAQPYHLFAVGPMESQATFLPTGVWYWHFLRRREQDAGLPAQDDLYLPGVFRAQLWPEDNVALTLIITTEDLSQQTFNSRRLQQMYEEAVDYQRDLLQSQRYFGEGGMSPHHHPVLPFSSAEDEEDRYPRGEEFLRLLLQAGHRFLTQRRIEPDEIATRRASFLPESQAIPAIIPGYYATEDCVRDTLIALPGLLLATSRFAEAQRILSTLARYFKQGMLPDRLPTPGNSLSEQDYGSVDTTLWYFYALDAYTRATRDFDLLDYLYDRLEESISWYLHGTFNGIRVDPLDGLLHAQAEGKALTWMNARAGQAPVTPRHGKPVEVNALWHHALSLMHEWSELLHRAGRLGYRTAFYEEQRQQCRQSFNERFWYAEGGYLYDVVDGPTQNDSSFRPNQLFALSLHYPVLDQRYWRKVFDNVTDHLITDYGLRSLAPGATHYVGQLPECVEEQQRGLHQGGAWPWLIGAYVDALLQVEHVSPTLETESAQKAFNTAARRNVWQRGIQLLEPFRKQLSAGMLASIGSVYDGDESNQHVHYQLADARSTGELLRVYKLLAHLGIRFSDSHTQVV